MYSIKACLQARANTIVYNKTQVGLFNPASTAQCKKGFRSLVHSNQKGQKERRKDKIN